MKFNEEHNAAHLLIVFALFIAVPIGYCLDFYIIYNFISGQERFEGWQIKEKIGILFLLIWPPIFHFLGHSYCKENLGWFKKND